MWIELENKQADWHSSASHAEDRGSLDQSSTQQILSFATARIVLKWGSRSGRRLSPADLATRSSYLSKLEL
jgi:hypothetical protein